MTTLTKRLLIFIFPLIAIGCSSDPDSKKITSESGPQKEDVEYTSPGGFAPPESEEPAEQQNLEIVVSENQDINTPNSEEQEPSNEEAVPKKVKLDKKKAPKKRKKKRKAIITFEKDNHHYGTIKQGEEVTHQFKFKNTGNRDLVIKNVTASCGCTQPSYPFIPIEPGEEGYIGVVFKSKGRLGKQQPYVTVVTNAYPHTYKLYLSGFVDASEE